MSAATVTRNATPTTTEWAAILLRATFSPIGAPRDWMAIVNRVAPMVGGNASELSAILQPIADVLVEHGILARAPSYASYRLTDTGRGALLLSTPAAA